jgi:hypothetical protein
LTFLLGLKSSIFRRGFLWYKTQIDSNPGGFDTF